MDFKKLIIICGHYGSGKTNFSLNLALKLAGEGKKIAVADLDIVNPYFRSSDYKDMPNFANINIITPNFAGTTLEIPSLSPQINGLFKGEFDHLIFDVGGDAEGATAIGSYSNKITENNYDMLFYFGVIKNVPQGNNEMIDLFKKYAEDLVGIIYGGNAMVMIVTAILAMAYKAIPFSAFVFVTTLFLYAMPYILYTRNPFVVEEEAKEKTKEKPAFDKIDAYNRLLNN